MRKTLSILLASLIVLLSFAGVVSAATTSNYNKSYTVLLLDQSGSMYGEPMEAEQLAAKLFCQTVLNGNGENYISIVYFDSQAYFSEFTENFDTLNATIDDLYPYGGTNIADALATALTLLEDYKDDPQVTKNIVLCSDGLPESGATSIDGPYGSEMNVVDNEGEVFDYTYFNQVFRQAEVLKSYDYAIYTLGFFHTLNDECKRAGEKLLSDIQNKGYFEVTDPDALDYSFIKIANDIANSDDKSIEIRSTSPSFNLFTGQTISVGFALVEDSKVLDAWSKMAFTVSNPDVISVTDYKKQDEGYTLDIKANKPGVSYFQISDSKTGVSTTCKLNVVDPSSIRMYPIRKSFGVKEINYITFDNYYYEYDNNSDEYVIHLDAYNPLFSSGAIDIFDKNGKWIDYAEIEKNSNPHDYYELGEKIYYVITDLATNKVNTYKSDWANKHTHLDFRVPQGGYFTISNNYLDSRGTFIVNSLNLFFEGVSLTMDLLSDLEDAMGDLKAAEQKELEDSIKKKAKKKIKNDIKQSFISDGTTGANTKATKALMKVLRKGTNISTDPSRRKEVESIIQDAMEDIFRINNYDVKLGLKNAFKTAISDTSANAKQKEKLLKECTGKIESMYYKTPAGSIVKFSFVGVRIIDYHALLTALMDSVEYDYSTYKFYSESYKPNTKEKKALKDCGIIIEQNDEALPDAQVQAFKVNYDKTINYVDNNYYSDLTFTNTEVYNISILKNNKKVQITDPVKVYIPAPKGINKDTCSVYRQESNGEWTKLDAWVEGEYIVFETDHFSYYAITGTPESISIKHLPNKTTYNIYDSLDTAGLTLQVGDQVISSGFECDPVFLNKAGDFTVTVSYGHTEATFTVQVVKNGFVLDSDDVIRYYNSGKIATELTDVKIDSLRDNWYNVVKGVVTPGPTIAQNFNGWWYIDKYGKVDFNAQGIYQNKFGWWKTTNGKVTFKENGVFQNGYGWWRVKDSKVDFKAQGIYQNQYGWWKTTNGKVTFKENGVFQNEYGWWKVKDSKVDFGFTGIASNKYGSWYIKNGKVDFNKKGKVKYNNKTYTIKNGKVV